jgi:hypothetical protein
MVIRSFLLNKRRSFIGGSDARVIMGDDEDAQILLWREKRGEVEPKDLSGNLIVQLGVVTGQHRACNHGCPAANPAPDPALDGGYA